MDLGARPKCRIGLEDLDEEFQGVSTLTLLKINDFRSLRKTTSKVIRKIRARLKLLPRKNHRAVGARHQTSYVGLNTV